MNDPIDTPTPPLYHCDGPIATITLNRAQHRNRLHDEDLQTLVRHVEAANRDTAVRVLVLAARVLPHAPVFSAGFHLGSFGADAGAAVDAFARAADALASARPLTVAALAGSVYGGATDLALACDVRIGVHGLQWRVPAATLGLHYYTSGLRRALATLGLNATRRLFLRAQTLTADELLALGALDALVPADELDAAVQRCVTELLALAPLAVQGMKQTLNEMVCGEHRPAQWRAREQGTHASCDFAEGRAAALERRLASFEGR